MQNMGCDIRVLQMPRSEAKDPDEYILKYGSARFKKLMDNAISLVEYKIKILRQDLNLENASDKIKFLNEIAKLLSKIDNTIEREIYIEKITKGYNISKEAIYAEVTKLKYKDNQGSKILESDRNIVRRRNPEKKNIVSEDIIKRENTIISILLNDPSTAELIHKNIKIEDFKDERNIEILSQIYKEIEKEHDNLSIIVDHIEDDEIRNHLAKIMVEDYGIADNKKAIQDIVKKYNAEKLKNRRDEILEKIELETDSEKKKALGQELNDIILKLALNGKE